MRKRAEIPRLLLVSGVPGTGKSVFVNWLAGDQRFRVLQVDNPADAPSVNSILGPALRGQIVEAQKVAQGLAEKLVIEYGVPPDVALGHIEALRKVGFDAWWFDCDDPAEAFRHYMKGKPPDAAADFYAQVGRIMAHKPSIARLYKGRTIVSLRGRTHLKLKVILEQILKGARKK
jgi:hypothetical protein